MKCPTPYLTERRGDAMEQNQYRAFISYRHVSPDDKIAALAVKISEHLFYFLEDVGHVALISGVVDISFLIEKYKFYSCRSNIYA